MQLKNALIGAIVGGLLGVGFLIAAFLFFGAQHTALAVVVAVLVGAGVRAMVLTKGHASYLRGAVTALIAIIAFVGGNIVVAQVAKSRMAADAAEPMRMASLPEQNAEAAADSSTEASTEPVAEEVEVRRSAVPTGGGVRGPLKASYTWPDFILLSLATLIAYELGRGSGTSSAATTTQPEAPAATA